MRYPANVKNNNNIPSPGTSYYPAHTSSGISRRRRRHAGSGGGNGPSRPPSGRPVRRYRRRPIPLSLRPDRTPPAKYNVRTPRTFPPTCPQKHRLRPVPVWLDDNVRCVVLRGVLHHQAKECLDRVVVHGGIANRPLDVGFHRQNPRAFKLVHEGTEGAFDTSPRGRGETAPTGEGRGRHGGALRAFRSDRPMMVTRIRFLMSRSFPRGEGGKARAILGARYLSIRPTEARDPACVRPPRPI